MRILSLVILALALYFSNQKTESPHGSDFKVSCKTCHSAKGWQLDKAIYSFDHNKTKLPLVGQHTELNCRLCHKTLVFSEAKTDCNQCHNDIHQNTVGLDCSRCHTAESWLVNNITGIHRSSRFPLVGAHVTADCIQCHKSESLLRFDVPGVNCIDCHREDYMATTKPNHVQSGISQDCSTCHPVNSLQWTGAGFNHNFFPLIQAHSALKCTDCHTTGNFNEAKPVCYSCHQQDYTAAKNPDHVASKLPTSCENCHTLNPGWKPATFDHSKFPLTQGHMGVNCTECHINGNYTSTSADCYSCHQADYNSTTNPNHKTSGFPTTCTQCHTTSPGWKPASFTHTRFSLTLGHAGLTCTECHKNGNYTSTSAECYSCHVTDYNNSVNPNHRTLNFATVCTQCHTTNPGWKPASYAQHDAQEFPIYSGKHRGQWTTCSECHTNLSNYSVFSCITCHEHNKAEMDSEHAGRNGYAYNSAACYNCHPRGSAK